MTILRKNFKTSVILGSPGQNAVIGTPGSPAYYSIQKVSEWKWVDGPGITWKKVPNTSSTPSGTWAYDVNGKPVWVPFDSGNDGVLGGTQWKWVPLYLGSENVEGRIIKEYKYVTTLEVIYHPAIAPVASVGYLPPTPNQISQSLNAGWNSYAISINDLVVGKYFVFTLAAGITGAFIGVGPKNMYGKPISTFKHGISVDPSGIKAQENGSVVATLRNGVMPTSLVRVHRQPDNSIVYAVTTGTETKVFKSQITPNLGSLYIHGYLYSGGDRILSAEFKTGKVVFGAVK